MGEVALDGGGRDAQFIEQALLAEALAQSQEVVNFVVAFRRRHSGSGECNCLALDRPVDQVQSLDARKVFGVVADQREAACDGLTGNQRVRQADAPAAQIPAHLR